MADLAKGRRISLTNGGCVTIIKELGRGGQGIVYLVDLRMQSYYKKVKCGKI